MRENAADISSDKWTFPARFRAGAYGWKSSSLACQRLREAVSTIKKVAKKGPIPGAEGTVRLVEKLWPALEHVWDRPSTGRWMRRNPRGFGPFFPLTGSSGIGFPLIFAFHLQGDWISGK